MHREDKHTGRNQAKIDPLRVTYIFSSNSLLSTTGSHPINSAKSSVGLPCKEPCAKSPDKAQGLVLPTPLQKLYSVGLPCKEPRAKNPDKAQGLVLPTPLPKRLHAVQPNKTIHLKNTADQHSRTLMAAPKSSTTRSICCSKLMRPPTSTTGTVFLGF